MTEEEVGRIQIDYKALNKEASVQMRPTRPSETSVFALTDETRETKRINTAPAPTSHPHPPRTSLRATQWVCFALGPRSNLARLWSETSTGPGSHHSPRTYLSQKAGGKGEELVLFEARPEMWH